MTDKRDLKRRVRERQAETGESYVTALRQVRAQAPAPDSSAGQIDVIEMIDVSEVAAPLGYKIKVSVQPRLVDKIDIAATLTTYRDLLIATTRDRELELMRDVVLRGLRPQVNVRLAWAFGELRQFLDRARSGLGGVSEHGTLVAMTVEGRARPLMILFHLALRHLFPHVKRDPSLTLAELDPRVPGIEWEVIPW